MLRFIMTIILILSFMSVCYGQETSVICYDYDTALILSREQDIPILLVFTSDWCAFCEKLKTEVIEDGSLDKTIICIIDIEKNKELSKDFNIKSLPTSVIIRESEQIDRKIGYKNKEDYINWVNKTNQKKKRFLFKKF